MYVIDAPVVPSVAVDGSADRFPVHRIYCIGRNYADHAKEMGATVDRGNPVFFLKVADSIWNHAAPVPYPPATSDLHHEVELVVALRGGGANLRASQVAALIYGYAVGLDLTRRDLQAAAKAKGLPWDTGKSFDAAAPIGALKAMPGALLEQGELRLEVNGELRQASDIGEMIFPVTEIVARLSELYTLTAGDLIFTGTPAGVGPLQPGDRFNARCADLPPLDGAMGPPRPTHA